MEEFMSLVERQSQMPPRKFKREMARFAKRFPQIVLTAEKLILEENLPEGGMAILATVGTPAAYAALRRFGLSQAGDEQIRMQALTTLKEANQIAQDEVLRVWIDGEWREIQLRQYEVSDEPDVFYEPKVADLLNRGLKAFKRDKTEQAERLFQRALELDPRAKEAYNNLGTLYSHRGEYERAKEMLQAAIDVDPTYVFPRANLALYLLDEDDIEGAEAMLAPLAEVSQFQPQEMAFYCYIQARLLMRKEDEDGARHLLEMALQVVPDYELAQNMLERLDMATRFQTGWESFMDRQRKRNQTKRVRLQSKLSTSEPTLLEALPLYSKDALTAMARVVIPGGGWSGLRKAELLQRIIDLLDDRDNLEHIVAALNDDERDALRQVLAGGGNLAWQDFEARYGNDLEESPHWQYHVPETVMGRLRLRGLLVEGTIDQKLLIVVPTELRQVLREILA
jgi:tetratricopeptide (TPR) repeat protein